MLIRFFIDSRAILTNPDVKGETGWFHLLRNDFWGTSLSHSGSHKSYRPLVVMSFRLQWWLHGSNPIWFHAANLWLHMLVVCLYIHLCIRLAGRKIGWIAGLLFCVQPTHVEPVASVVGRSDLASGFWMLGSLFAYDRFIRISWPEKAKYRLPKMSTFYLIISLISSLCALLCKENAIFTLPMCGLLHFLFVWRLAVKQTTGKCNPKRIFQFMHQVMIAMVSQRMNLINLANVERWPFIKFIKN